MTCQRSIRAGHLRRDGLPAREFADKQGRRAAIGTADLPSFISIRYTTSPLHEVAKEGNGSAHTATAMRIECTQYAVVSHQADFSELQIGPLLWYVGIQKWGKHEHSKNLRLWHKFHAEDVKYATEEEIYDCSPEGPNTTKRIYAESAQDVRAYFRQLRQKGGSRDRALKLSTLDLVDLWERQRGLCAISGHKMTHVFGRENVWNASPDQIIPASKGGDYSPANVRLICKLFQTMRGNLDDMEFKNAILEAADHIRAKAGTLLSATA